MTNILAGIAASILSFILNKILFFYLGGQVIIYLIPLGEELFKTGAAYYFKGNLVIVHLVFGMVEAGFDVLHSNSLAALLALLTHLLLGVLTFSIWRTSNDLIGAVVIVVLVHSVWNYSIRRLKHEINL